VASGDEMHHPASFINAAIILQMTVQHPPDVLEES